MARILVLDGHSAAALAFTRSLGRAGDWVAVGYGVGWFAPAALSRYCQASLIYRDPTKDVSGFKQDLLKFVCEQQIELVVPITDWTTIPVSLCREQIERFCRVAITSHRALELVSDKYETIQLARSLQVPIPETWLIRDLSDLDNLPSMTFPLVVKDRASARWIGNEAVIGSVAYAYDEESLRRIVGERLTAVGDVLIQSFVAGKGIGFSCFAHEGNILLPFQWARVRETDPRGSGSSARESVALDADVAEFSRKLIQAAGFEGISMVEFKRDPRTGSIALMEINGRPWGSLQLPIFSGIDYPKYLVDWYLRQALPPAEIPYKTGIMCRRMIGELTHLDNLRRGKPPQWPAAYPNFWTSLVRIAIPWYPGMRYDDLSFSDPRPGLSGLYKWFRDRLTKKVSSKTTKRKVSGIIHCHTTYSYDGKLTISEFCDVLRREGFNFVALTEHTQGLTAERYAKLVKECADLSDANFVAIPGLELRCGEGIEMAALGVFDWLDDAPPAQAVAAIRAAKGFAVWVHPFKNGTWAKPFLDCDAVEILNGKVDGVLAPNFSLLGKFREHRRNGRSFHATFGLDFHNLRQQRCVWIECEVEKLSASDIVRALQEGHFASRVSHGKMSSQGEIGVWPQFKMRSLQLLLAGWKGVLQIAPAAVRTSLLRVGRPFADLVKRRS